SKGIRDVIEISKPDTDKGKQKKMTKAEKTKLIEQLTAEMKRAAKELDFEYAATLRDKIEELRS
ncbi:MAG: UvrB/UvrC motif-containing protein, partial [Bacillota bacterium]|nr:UvrB/UvrC motif-containing protein [Bacillota bacterium]